MLPPWPLRLRHSHSCLYTRSVLERKKMNCDTVVIVPVHEDCLFLFLFEFLRPFVRGTPTTHSEGLLLQEGALPCAPSYNRGVVQYVVFNRLGLAQPHECSSKAAIYHANSSATSSNTVICTEDVTAARRTLQRLHTDIFSGHDLSSSSSNPRTSAN